MMLDDGGASASLLGGPADLYDAPPVPPGPVDVRKLLLGPIEEVQDRYVGPVELRHAPGQAADSGVGLICVCVWWGGGGMGTLVHGGARPVQGSLGGR